MTEKILEFTLYGDPRTKKNSQRIVTLKSRYGDDFHKVLPSAAYIQYARDCKRQITGRQRIKIDRRVNLKAVYYMKTHRTVDLPNLQEATCDILVESGVLADDNSNIVATQDGSYVDYDKLNPRVEITITAKENEQ